MKRYVEIKIKGLIEVEDESEIKEVVEDIVMSADIDYDSYEYQDFGEYKE